MGEDEGGTRRFGRKSAKNAVSVGQVWRRRRDGLHLLVTSAAQNRSQLDVEWHGVGKPETVGRTSASIAGWNSLYEYVSSENEEQE